MATALVRPLSFSDIGFSEHDQDPNTALLELDRGLKSSKTGEQCESISRFPSFFEKYPFPVLINSALLKLAEVFRQESSGSNFVRVCVVEVIESCGRHLDKLINVDEFLLRIISVMHSNDTMARALTLRTLGWMSGVVGENHQVHHLIREALDAKDSIELQSAIMAAEKYASKSKTFSMNMCEKLIQMISGLATPVDVKLQLIQIFQHMHHDAETASTVRSLCLELLKEYPTQRVVITTLHTLTQLAAHCLADIPDQVDLLMSYLQSETRLGVRRAILRELQFLSEAAPHAWSSKNVNTLVEYTRASHFSYAATSSALAVLATLIAAPSLPQLSLTIDCSLLELCRECVYSPKLGVACTALQLYTNIAMYMRENSTSSICEEAHEAALSFLQAAVSSNGNGSADSNVPCGLAVGLICAVTVAKNDATVCTSLVNFLTGILLDNCLSVDSCILLADALASLGSCHCDVLTPYMNPVLQLIQKYTEKATLIPNETKYLVTLVTLILQLFHCHVWSSKAEAIVLAASKRVSYWYMYKIARQASRYGHHSLASGLYNTLSSRVCSDQQHFWLVALTELSKGEACLSGDGDLADNLTNGNMFLHKAFPSFKAASSYDHPLNFCLDYVKLRAEMLISHAQLLHACLSLRTAPPPAIAVNQTSSRDDLMRCGRVSQQLAKSAKDFSQLASQYDVLYQSIFDADSLTLSNVALLQQFALLMVHAIEVITKPSINQIGEEFIEPDLSFITKLGGNESIECKTLMSVLYESSQLIKKLIQVCYEIRPIREHHLHILQTLSRTITSVPLPYPRLFFQSLQSTTITLNVSPQPRTPGDPISVQTSSHLAVKVEGVITLGKRPGLFRSVQSVTLTVVSQIQSRLQHTLDLKVEPNETFSQTVEPHNDFFSAQFLLGFPVPGQYQVVIDASVTDQEDGIWLTGPRHTLMVKSQEDPSTKSTQPVRPPVPPPAQFHLHSTAPPVVVPPTSSSGPSFPSIRPML